MDQEIIEQAQHRAATGAGGLGAILLAILGGVARHGDDVVRGAARYSDDIARVAIQPADDLAVSASRFHVPSHLSRIQFRPAGRGDSISIQCESLQPESWRPIVDGVRHGVQYVAESERE